VEQRRDVKVGTTGEALCVTLGTTALKR